MALEFRTKDENFKGPQVLPAGTTIQQASLFVDRLPPRFPTDRYHLHLVNDMYSHIPRYVIDAKIMVSYDHLVLVPKETGGLNNGSVKAISPIHNSKIERLGLDVLLSYQDNQYQGTLYPMPELAEESTQQDHTTKQQH
jgi:hypothetical protein